MIPFVLRGLLGEWVWSYQAVNKVPRDEQIFVVDV